MTLPSWRYTLNEPVSGPASAKKIQNSRPIEVEKGIGNFCHTSSPRARVATAKIFQPVVLNLCGQRPSAEKKHFR